MLILLNNSTVEFNPVRTPRLTVWFCVTWRQNTSAGFIKLEATTLQDGDNPIKKLGLVCSESQGIVNLDVILSGEQADFDGTHNALDLVGAIQMQWQYNGDM